MTKNAFKIVCDLIRKQAVTYEEAQILIEALLNPKTDTDIPPIQPCIPINVYPNTPNPLNPFWYSTTTGATGINNSKE